MHLVGKRKVLVYLLIAILLFNVVIFLRTSNALNKRWMTSLKALRDWKYDNLFPSTQSAISNLSSLMTTSPLPLSYNNTATNTNNTSNGTRTDNTHNNNLIRQKSFKVSKSVSGVIPVYKMADYRNPIILEQPTATAKTLQANVNGKRKRVNKRQSFLLDPRNDAYDANYYVREKQFTTPDDGDDYYEYVQTKVNNRQRMKRRMNMKAKIRNRVVADHQDSDESTTTTTTNGPNDDTNINIVSIKDNSTDFNSVSEYAVTIENVSIPPDDENTFRGVSSRAFTRWPSNVTLPCDPQNYTYAIKEWGQTNSGIIFISPMKTGSTTAAGVNLRLAKNIAQSLDHEMCKVRYNHGRAFKIIPQPSKTRSFVWTVLREPTKRVISHYFYFITGTIEKPTDHNFQNFCLNTKKYGSSFVTNHYLGRLPLSYGEVPKNDSLALELANEVIREYNFIAIMERMDESLVALATLVGVPVTHVLFLKGNKASGEFSRHSSREECHYIKPSFVSPAMKEFFESEKWKKLTYWDLAIFQAANRSLDLTIESLGEDYRRNMDIYKRAQERARVVCTPRTIYPCNEKGEFRNDTNCLFLDSGCGNDCLDEVALEFQSETGLIVK